MEEEKNSNAFGNVTWKNLITVFALFVSVFGGIVGWFASEALSLRIEIERINSNRFTVADGAGLLREVVEVRAECAKPKPLPRWLTDKTKDLTDRIQRMEATLYRTIKATRLIRNRTIK